LAPQHGEHTVAEVPAAVGTENDAPDASSTAKRIQDLEDELANLKATSLEVSVAQPRLGLCRRAVRPWRRTTARID